MAEDRTQPLSPGPANVSRREFVKSVGAAALAGSAPLVGARRATGADRVGPSPTAPAETAVARFYKALSDEQKKLICFKFNHPKRLQVNNNWAIVKPTIADLTKEQR